MLIKKGEYKDFYQDFKEKRYSYTSLIFEELSELLLNYYLRDTQIISSGSYWDANVEIDIMTITTNEKTYIAECKWKNHKVNKKELHKLKEKCDKLDITPTQIILFSKSGFSKELLSMQNHKLALFNAEDFKILLKRGK